MLTMDDIIRMGMAGVTKIYIESTGYHALEKLICERIGILNPDNTSFITVNEIRIAGVTIIKAEPFQFDRVTFFPNQCSDINYFVPPIPRGFKCSTDDTGDEQLPEKFDPDDLDIGELLDDV